MTCYCSHDVEYSKKTLPRVVHLQPSPSWREMLLRWDSHRLIFSDDLLPSCLAFPLFPFSHSLFQHLNMDLTHENGCDIALSSY